MKQSPEIRLIRRSSNWSLDFYWRPYEGAKLKRKIVAVARTKELAKPFRKDLLDSLEAGTFTGVMPWKIPAPKVWHNR